MAQQAFIQAATASLSANGTSTANGSITWSAPALPDGVASWDSVTISGQWAWNGKGNITHVTINGTNTTDGSPFEITLPTGQASPLSISCVGNNKNATGNSFRWSNLVVTYTCTVASTDNFWIGIGGQAVPVKKVWRAVNGALIEIDPTTLDRNIKYIRAE